MAGPARQNFKLSLPRPPRWWRKFMLDARRANLFLWLEIIAGLALVLAIWATYAAYTSAPGDDNLLPTMQVSLLLMATLVPAMALLVLVGRRLALKRAAGSTARLHVRLVFFFSMVAALPTLLVAGFAAFLFQTGVDFWFSDDSRGLMENANALAQSYYDANQRDVQQETLAMASDMRFVLERVDITDSDFPDFYALQAQGRKISESAILQRMPDGTLRTAAILNLTEDDSALRFTETALERLDAGEFVVVTGNPERIEALSSIDPSTGILLYNARTTEESMFNSWARAQSIVAAYQRLTGSARTLQLRFNIALVSVSLLLVGLAIWFALRFADRQVEPLTNLVAAAREVGQGNFALRVAGRTGADEIGLLNRAFNRMTSQLEKQTQALVKANRQIDDRRAFTEAVLESVTAGVISLDDAGCITLINGFAQNLLAPVGSDADGPRPMIGRSLDELAPELSQMAREGRERAVITHAKGNELLTLAVRVAPGSRGFVITFEDITRQILDQRQAAWSDVARRIAHEIKNPLTPIQLATERLKRRYRKQVEPEDSELFDELTSTIVRQVDDLRKMVDEFSSFARLPKPVFRHEDAVDLVRQAVFLQEVAHSGIGFSISTDEITMREVLCDRHQFGQAMTNVLKNGVEAIEARAAESGNDYAGRIAVTMKDHGETIAVTIEDNGIGLPADRERIIEPYVTTREKGTGLGLAIVHKIIDEHGGEMSFASGETGGTLVTLQFARQPPLSERVPG